jgi:hypothetical protein
LSQEVAHILAEAVESAEPEAITDLRGLGKQHWAGVDAGRHVETERRSWD